MHEQGKKIALVSDHSYISNVLIDSLSLILSGTMEEMMIHFYFASSSCQKIKTQLRGMNRYNILIPA